MYPCEKDNFVNVKREEEIALGNRLTDSKLFGVGWAPTFFSFHLDSNCNSYFFLISKLAVFPSLSYFIHLIF